MLILILLDSQNNTLKCNGACVKISSADLNIQLFENLATIWNSDLRPFLSLFQHCV